MQEFYAKCRMSQELIYAQIPWASAGAERSRNQQDELRANGHSTLQQTTQEELLLAEILRSNEELTDALRMYDEMRERQEALEAQQLSRMEYLSGRVRFKIHSLLASLVYICNRLGMHQLMKNICKTHDPYTLRDLVLPRLLISHLIRLASYLLLQHCIHRDPSIVCLEAGYTCNPMA